MFQTPYTCIACQRLSVTLESSEVLYGMHQLPNTFDVQQGAFVWKFHQYMGYAIIPRMFTKTTALVDLYLCIDESDRETIDVCGYAKRFLQEEVFPVWKKLKLIELSLPELSCPRHVACRKQGIVERRAS